MIHQVVYESLCRIFQLHGAVKLNSPLMLPKGDIQDTYESWCCLMDRSGQLVTLPYDLRVSERQTTPAANLWCVADLVF